jgi:hypothetical protein
VSVAVVCLAAAVVNASLRLHEVQDALGVVCALKVTGKTAQESWFENTVVAKLVCGLTMVVIVVGVSCRVVVGLVAILVLVVVLGAPDASDIAGEVVANETGIWR